jgi:hypothetical protein
MTATVGRQILNGLRLASLGFAWVLLLFGLFDGIGRFAGYECPIQVSVKSLAGLAELLVAPAILFLTINAWSKWVAPVAIFVALKSLVGFIAGTTVSLPFRPIPRSVAGETLLFLLGVGLLSMRFTTHVPRGVERLALVAVVFAACWDMAFEPQPLALAIGLGSLIVARATLLRDRTRRHREL